MKIKTAELTGAALDWTVARIEEADIGRGYYTDMVGRGTFSTSTDWDRGGLIIDREFITVGPYHDRQGKPTGTFQAYIGWDSEALEPLFQADGPTPLTAAMRCYVASKLGDEVEIPEELCQT